MLTTLGLTEEISVSTPIDPKVIEEDAFRDLCAAHWRKYGLSSALSKTSMRSYYRSGTAMEDVSLASWWSTVNVESVDLERKTPFAHLEPSDTYVKAYYKLLELEVALSSSCLTTDQLARILQKFPRDDQIRAEVVVSFYHKVTDINEMCLLVDSLRPDEQREVISRRGLLNIINPLYADRYYHLNLSVWDERETAKILIKL
ncbi:unnamed protein product, partial [Choristocarpus tenellus]